MIVSLAVSPSNVLRNLIAGITLVTLGFVESPNRGYAQPPAVPSDSPPRIIEDGPAGPASADDRETRLSDYLSGATFTGQFTVDGREDGQLRPESYKIIECRKLDAANTYEMKVAIRYGDTDGEFPMALTILWSGNTPVITLDAVWIPGLGTFSARVLLHDGRYAGTWQHDAKGGHLFGKITPRDTP